MKGFSPGKDKQARVINQLQLQDVVVVIKHCLEERVAGGENVFLIYCTLYRKKISEGQTLGVAVFEDPPECLMLPGGHSSL